MDKMNKKQKCVYDAIKNHWTEHGFAPSVRDLLRVLPYKSTSVIQLYIDQLHAGGFISKQENISRSVRVVK